MPFRFRLFRATPPTLLSVGLLSVCLAANAWAQDKPLAVRAGAHETYDRLVFDWPKASAPKLERNGKTITLHFQESAALDLTPIKRAKLSRVSDARLGEKTEKSLSVSFTTSETAQIKLFENGTSVVVDIYAPTTGTPQQESKETAPPPADVKTPAPAAETKKESPKQIATESPKADPKEQPLEPEKPKAAAIIPVQEESIKAAETPIPAEEPKTVRKKPPKIDLGATPELILTLDTKTDVGVAVFVRASYGYVIFDRKIALPLSKLTEGFSAPRVDVEPLNLANGGGFRFLLPPNTSLRTTKKDTAWSFFLTKDSLDNLVSDALVAQPDFALGSRLVAYILNPPEPIRLTDPEVGDDLVVVPLKQPDAFSSGSRFAELEVFPATQGLVVRPLVQALNINKVSDGIEITLSGGLKLSPSSDTVLQQSYAAKKEAGGKRLFFFSRWAGKQGESFIETRQRLYQTIAEVPEAERNRARLELARFYFAQGRAQEAYGVLSVLLEKNPEFKNYADFMALSGAVKILMGRAVDGLKDLDLPDIKFTPDAQLWQAIANVQTNSFNAAAQGFLARRAVLSSYPDPFYTPFSVLAAEALTATDHDSDAEEIISEVEAAPHNERYDPALKYIHAVIHSKAGRQKIAETLWKEVAHSTDRLYKTRADLALIELGVATGSLTAKQAADKLELLRFAWRGDELEVDILHRLGLYYFESRNIKAGVDILASINRLYPNTPERDTISIEMKNAFRNVFLDEKTALPALDALALFQSQNALIQTDESRIPITQSLVEKLVAVDLLEPAAQILETLTKDALKGDEKVKTSTRLAGIRLLDKKPAAALAALLLVGNDPVSETAQYERKILQARALADLKKPDEALAVLGGDASAPAQMLKIDIAVRASKWMEAGALLYTLIEPLATKPTLSPKETDWVITCATAYAMNNNTTGLELLDKQFGNKMAATKQADMFRLLTHAEDIGPLRNLSGVSSKISEVDMFRQFLDSYRTNTKP